jgi:hypothetical protein
LPAETVVSAQARRQSWNILSEKEKEKGRKRRGERQNEKDKEKRDVREGHEKRHAGRERPEGDHLQ